jgi:hypothetical protein
MNWNIHLRICVLFSDAAFTSEYAESSSVPISELARYLTKVIEENHEKSLRIFRGPVEISNGNLLLRYLFYHLTRY